MSLKVQVLVLCFLEWTVVAQFGSMTITVSDMGGAKTGDKDLEIKGNCPPNTVCKPVSSCPLLGDLIETSCFTSDKYFHRVNQLTCGHANNEDYVCCPSCDCTRVFSEGTQRCGQSMVNANNYSGIGAHPWVVRVGFTHKESGKVQFFCSGSIISKRIILTAAHCALAEIEGYKLSTVLVGEWDTGRKLDCNDVFCAPRTQAIEVKNVVAHEGYDQKIFRHNIALIVLKEAIKYSVTAAPVCLYDKPEVVIKERALLVGWGQLSGQNNTMSKQQILDLPVATLETCKSIYKKAVPVQEGQLCAGGEEGKDACSGFGGAPLLLHRDEKYMQVGITSFGSKKCGTKGVPSVFTNVAHYHQWIVDNSPSF